MNQAILPDHKQRTQTEHGFNWGDALVDKCGWINCLSPVEMYILAAQEYREETKSQNANEPCFQYPLDAPPELPDFTWSPEDDGSSLTIFFADVPVATLPPATDCMKVIDAAMAARIIEPDSAIRITTQGIELRRRDGSIQQISY